jgi:hypothetical protein
MTTTGTRCERCACALADDGWFFTNEVRTFQHLCESCARAELEEYDDPGWVYHEWVAVFPGHEALPGVCALPWVDAELCECCRRAAPTPYEYACLPHVRFDRMCAKCADEARQECEQEVGPIPADESTWYLRERFSLASVMKEA